MSCTQRIDWSDLESAAKEMVGNWRDFDNFVWSRGYDLKGADKWCISYTGHRDAGLLAQSNGQEINRRLQPFSEGVGPDVVFESHSHWAVGYVDGFSLRVYRADGSITPAFEEFCRIKQALESYAVLNESDYSEREYNATLENYKNEMWRCQLPEGWEAAVYRWFSDNGRDEYLENRDDQGGWAPREAINGVLQKLGLMPDESNT